MNIIKITYLVKNFTGFSHNIHSPIVDYCKSHNVYYDCSNTASPRIVGVTVFLTVDFSKVKLQYSSCVYSESMYEGMLFTVDDNNEVVPEYDHNPFYIYEHMTYDVLPYTVKQVKQFSEAFVMKFPWMI